MVCVQLGLFGQPHMCGDVLQASLGDCSVPNPPVSTGAAVITLPSPTAIVNFSSASLNLACAGSAASLPPISAPVSTSLVATVRLSDGSQRELSDKRARFSTTGPCVVTRDQRDVPVVSVLPSKQASVPSNTSHCATGTCTITLTYPTLNESLQQTLSIPVIDVESVSILPQSYDAPAVCTLPPNGTLSELLASSQGSAASPTIPLSPLACSLQDYQQATVCVIAQLTASTSRATTQAEEPSVPRDAVLSHVDVTAHVTLQASDESRLSILWNLFDDGVQNRLRPHGAGTFNITAVFGSVESPALSVVAAEATEENAVHVQSIHLEFSPKIGASLPGTAADCGYQCQRTLSGPRTTSTPLLATVILSDGFEYSPHTLLGSSNTDHDVANVFRLFSFASSQPDAVSVSALGDLNLLDNAAEGVMVEMRKKECTPTFRTNPTSSASVLNATDAMSQNTPSAVLEIFANLNAAVLDVDVGETFGPPIQLQSGGSSSSQAIQQSPRPLEVRNLDTDR